ncbi:MAG: ABC transporter substrate-binding protein [Alphaproteobacteria bacterium]|nr:ABC transporter substrate-binding protein [Alphaproteobacteria bacterium]
MYTFKNLTKFFSIALFSIFISFSSAFSQKTLTKISILQVIEHPALNATRDGFLDELKKLGYEEGKNLEIDYQSAQGNAALAAQIAQKFTSHESNIIVANGTKAAQAAMTAAKGTKTPVVFSSVTDPLGAKLVTSLKAPDGYVTGVSNFLGVEPQFKLFTRILPELKTLGVIYDPGEANSVSLNKAMEITAKKFDLKLVFAVATKTSEVLAASQSLCGRVDALFVNNDNTALGAFSSVVKAAKACDIPAFVSDVDMADQGASAAIGPNQTELGRQTARMVDVILKNPGAPLPSVEFPQKTEEYVKAHTNNQ